METRRYVFTLRTLLVTFLGLAVSVVLFGSDCENTRLEGLDNGRLEMSGYNVEPHHYPMRVIALTSVDDEAFGFDRDLIIQAVEWWNEQASRDGIQRNVFVVDDEAIPGTTGVIEVGVGYTGDSYEDGIPGIYEFYYDEEFIMYGVVTVSSDITYNDRTVIDVLRHELGHALGLDDDPDSIDLDSVMGSPLVYDGGLTEGDFGLVEESYEQWL